MDSASLATTADSYKTAPEVPTSSNEKRLSSAETTAKIFEWAEQTYGDLAEGVTTVKGLCRMLGVPEECPRPPRYSMPALDSNITADDEAVEEEAGSSTAPLRYRNSTQRPHTIIVPGPVERDLGPIPNFSRRFSTASSDTIPATPPPTHQSAHTGLSDRAFSKQPMRDVPYFDDGTSSLVAEPPSTDRSFSPATHPSITTDGPSASDTTGSSSRILPSISTRGSSSLATARSGSVALPSPSSSHLRRSSIRSIATPEPAHLADQRNEEIEATLHIARERLGGLDDLSLREARQVIQFQKEEFLRQNATRQGPVSRGGFCRNLLGPRLRLGRRQANDHRHSNSTYDEARDQANRALWEQTIAPEDMEGTDLRALGELAHEHRIENVRRQREERSKQQQEDDAMDSLRRAFWNTDKFKGFYNAAMRKLQHG